MRATGIVAEFTPLHNGHVYCMEQSRSITGADALVVAMSGNFVQRGEPAILDKWTRAGLALECGADLVVEIPALYCLGNAGQYADAGVRVLETLGKVDHLVFGSECGDTELLTRIVEFFREHAEQIEHEKSDLRDKRFSYPAATEKAYAAVREQYRTEGESDEDLERELKVLRSSNDILALEYIASCRSASPHAIRREGALYSDPLDEKFKYQSATSLRAWALDGRDISRYVPECTSKALSEIHITGPDTDKWHDALRYAVMMTASDDIEDCPSGGEGLANLMKSSVYDSYSWTKLARLVKSRRYTFTRIMRLCAQVLLGIRRAEYDEIQPGYIRVLGFNDTGRKLLSEIRKDESNDLPVITNISKSIRKLGDQERKLLELDIHAADIYNLMTGRDMKKESEYVRNPVIL
ncbi:MAG: nucleotidyltransferase family protein [Mogibacterium sp.]|nr:nucleotidyltransferase family protein [Mogibacterium sp.]